MQDRDYKSLPSILDVVNNSLHLRTARIINRRMEGASLHEIASEEGLTRTEVRSIEKKGLEKIFTDILEVREDEYRYVYENYSLEDEFYLSLYNGNQVLYYLKSRFELGFGSIDMASSDLNITDKVKKELSAFYAENNSSVQEDSTVEIQHEKPNTDVTFTYTFDNSENTLVVSEPTIYDSTFYSDNSSVPQYIRDLINDLWNSFQACGVTEPSKILEQASIFFFLKYLDDAELKNTAKCIANQVATNSLYFDSEHQICRWSNFHNLEATELLHTFNSKILPFIKNDLRVDTDLTYAQLVKNIQLSIADPTLLTKIISTIDSITSSSYVSLYAVFEELVLLSGTDTNVMELVTQLLNFRIDDVICNVYPSNDFNLNAIATFAKSEYRTELEKVWNKMHFENDMFHAYSTDKNALLIDSLRLLLLDIISPDFQESDIITTNCAKKFNKVIAKIPAKPAVNINYVRSSIRTMITANVPSLMYMYGCHQILESNGICILCVPHKNLIETTPSHKRLREFYIKKNTVLGVINLPTNNCDLLIYQNVSPHSFHQTLFARVDELNSDTIQLLSSLVYSHEESLNIYQDRSNPIFYVPDIELEDHSYRLGYEEYSTCLLDLDESLKDIELLDNILRRIYNTQTDIDKNITTIKRLLEKL